MEENSSESENETSIAGLRKRDGPKETLDSIESDEARPQDESCGVHENEEGSASLGKSPAANSALPATEANELASKSPANPQNTREEAAAALASNLRRVLLSKLPQNVQVKMVESPKGLQGAIVEGGGVAVLGVPLFFGEKEVQTLINFVEALARQNNDRVTIYLKLVGDRQDFEYLENLTNLTMINESGSSFTSVAVFHRHLGKFVGLNLNQLRASSPSLLASLRSPTAIDSASQFDDALANLSRDELLYVLCSPKGQADFSPTSRLLFESHRVTGDQIVPVLLDPRNKSCRCKPNEAMVLFRTEASQPNEPKKMSKSDPKFKLLTSKGKKFMRVKVDASAQDAKSDLSEKLAAAIDKETVFRNPWIKGSPRRFRIELNAELNQASKNELRQLREIVDSVRKELGTGADLFDFVLSPNTSASKKPAPLVTALDLHKLSTKSHLLHKNRDRKVMEDAIADDPFSLSQQGGAYKCPDGPITKDQLLAFCRDVQSGTAELYLKSQKEPTTFHFSRKVVASDFDQKVLRSGLSQMVFFHSHHCGSCKKFLPLYEEVALDFTRKKDLPLVFNRVDNEHNHIASQNVVLSTPKLAIFRSDAKDHPITYARNQLNRHLLEGFIRASLGFSLLRDWNCVDSAADRWAKTIQEAAWRAPVV